MLFITIFSTFHMVPDYIYSLELLFMLINVSLELPMIVRVSYIYKESYVNWKKVRPFYSRNCSCEAVLFMPHQFHQSLIPVATVSNIISFLRHP